MKDTETQQPQPNIDQQGDHGPVAQGQVILVSEPGDPKPRSPEMLQPAAQAEFANLNQPEPSLEPEYFAT